MSAPGGKIRLKLGKRGASVTAASTGTSRESAVDLTDSNAADGTATNGAGSSPTPTDRNSAATSQLHAGSQQSTHSTASSLKPQKEALNGNGSGTTGKPVPNSIQPKVKPEAAAASSTPFLQANDSAKPASTTRRPSSVLDYLISLGGNTLDQLYTDTFTSLTIFRSLPPLAKQYVLRLLLVDTLVAAPLLHSWVKVDSLAQQSHRLAEYRLKQLRILREGNPSAEQEFKVKKEEYASASDGSASAPRVRYYRLNRSFQKCIRNALFTQMNDPTLEGAEQPAADTHTINDATAVNGDPASGAAKGSPARHAISAEQLSTFAQNRWEAMLHFMVGAAAESSKPPADIQQRLVRMGFMTVQKQTVGKGKSSYTVDQHVITPVGFNFLFKDQSTQVWDLILSYIDTMSSDDEEMNRYEVLQFLFRLSFLRVGYRYDATALTTTQRKLLNDLHSFGLIYRSSPTSKRYAPTPLALTLSSAPTTAASQQTEAQKQQGFIVVETTFKMYAFTTSPFHMKLLSLFCRLDYRLPNMIVATITKESIRYALRNNISSNEIINYCEAYAHPQMKLQNPILPPTVVDQIRLWEKERERLKRTEAILVDDFDQLS